MEKLKFEEYLRATVGEEMAKRILDMEEGYEKEWRFVIITGPQMTTGKSTLARVLQEHGYLALELYEHLIVELNDEIKYQDQIPKFNTYVE